MNEAAPGDIVIGSGWQHGADGYAGIVVDHGRIVSDSSQGVQDNSSLSEIQRSYPGMIAVRYVGFWNYYRSKPLANAGFNADEPRLPAGQPGGGQWTSGGAGGVQMVPSTTALSRGNNWTPGQSKQNADAKKGQAADRAHAGGPLTDAQRKLLEQKNAEAVAIIARLGDKGEKPDTPESILNGPLKSTWGSNLGWMPGTPNWDLRQQYKGYSDQDIALMEAARRNGVRAAVLLAQAGQLPKSQVTALQLRGVGVLADATLNLGLALAPYDSIAALGSRALLGSAEGTVGAEAGELASRSGQVSDKPISTASSPDFGAVKWVPEPSTAMKEGPAAYQDGAPASRYGMAPQLSATDSNGTITAKFDGVDATTGEMVDRKTNVANSTKFADEALRQSVTAAKNGFGVRWEVPNATVQARAQRILSTNGIKNIRVVVAPRK